MRTRHIPRLLIAGTHSGVGKTSITAGIIAALRRRGLVVQPFKCGPDYIDPGYHGEAAGRPCRNLDSWMLSDPQVRDSFVRACEGADIAVIEGVMGLFDGSAFDDDRASAAQVSRLLEAPVVLVTDISGAGSSAAATVLGFTTLDPRVKVRGVLLNFAGSEGHAQGCAGAIMRHAKVPMLGWLPKNAGLAVPERNLGLLTARDTADLPRLIATLAEVVEARVDLSALLALAAEAPALPAPEQSPRASTGATGTPHRAPLLAVAIDEAFCFHYPDNLDLLRAEGVRIAPFSPLRGEAPSPDADGVYLGGGYPELHARTLSENHTFLDALRRLHDADRPLFAECGGFMVLTGAIVDASGTRHPMAGLVPGFTRMTERLQSMGYRHATCLHDTLLGATGTQLRAHEFHYSTWDIPEGLPAGRLAFRARGSGKAAAEHEAGWCKGRLLASYLHFHLGQDPALAAGFAAALRTPGRPVPVCLP